MTRIERAQQYFAYIMLYKKHWCHGFTLNRLARVRDYVIQNENIMWDLLDRHHGMDMSPYEMKERDPDTYAHCLGNFSTSILYTMMEKGIIKPAKTKPLTVGNGRL